MATIFPQMIINGAFSSGWWSSWWWLLFCRNKLCAYVMYAPAWGG